MTKIILIRHGQTFWNAEKRIMGQLNSPLSGVGEIQVAALASRLKAVPFTALYSSDLGRAMQTAQAIAKVCEKNIVERSELREKNVGIFQGYTKEESANLYPEQWLALMSGNYYSQPVPDGESDEGFYTRSVNIFNTLADKHSAETIAVVSHGGLIRKIFKYVLKLSSVENVNFSCRNTSVNIFSRDKDIWTLETWGDISHLDEVNKQPEKAIC